MSVFKKVFRSKKNKVEKNTNFLIEFLAKVQIFKNLSKHERKNLEDFVHIREYSSGDTVFKKNYPNVVMYIVMEGYLKIYIDENCQECVKDLEKYDYFGEFGIFIDETRTATVVAEKDSTLLAISKRDMKNFMHEYSKAGNKILFNLGQILSKNLVKTNLVVLDKQDEIEELQKKQEELETKIDELQAEIDSLRK